MNANPERVALGRRTQPEGYEKLATTPMPKPAFTCPECGKPFASEASLKGHILSHSRKKKEG